MTDDRGAAAPRIGVVGLGRMGLPIAHRLAASGYDVTGFDVAEDRMTKARGAGIRMARSAREMGRECGVLVVVLPGAAEFRDALIGPDGALGSMAPGSTWLDLTSNDPRVAAEIATRSAAAGVHAVGAPMGGGPAEAGSGGLRFQLSGAAAGRAVALPLLAALARPDGVRDLGDDISAGYTAKLLVNTLWFGQVAAVTEAMLLAERLGIAPSDFQDLLAGSAADSAFVRDHLGRLIDGDDATTFGLAGCVAELDIVQQLAHGSGTPFSLTDEVVRLHREALREIGPRDGEMLVARLLAARAGDSALAAADPA